MRGDSRCTAAVQVSSRVPGIDLLRGLSVLLVVLHHAHLRFWLGHYDVDVLPRPIARVLFWSGYYAVITFFVISGYLITGLSLRRWGALERISIRDFYALRAARIAPCLLLVVAALSGLHLAGVEGFVIDPARSSLPRAVLAALAFHVNWLEGHHGYLPGGWDVLWSLAVEEVFYLGFPLLCVSLRTPRSLIVPLLALVVLGPIHRTHLEGQAPWDDYAYLSCMDGIALGCLAALLSARLTPGRNALRACLWLGAAAALFVELFRSQVAALGLTTFNLNVTCLELGVAAMLFALGQGPAPAAPPRGTAWLRAVGRASYEIYLTHMFVLLLAMNAFEALGAGRGWIPATVVIMLAGSLALGLLLARYASEPCNRALRQRFAGGAAIGPSARSRKPIA